MTYFGPDTCKKMVRWLVPPLGLIESALRRIIVPVFLHNKYYSCLLFSFFVIATPAPPDAQCSAVTLALGHHWCA